MAPKPTIILFGYDSSPFTQKIRLSLKLRQVPHTFVVVSSMMPRPLLVTYFNLTYRKIPVLVIDTDVYIDTSLILEALASHPSYPVSSQHPPLHPDERTRTLTRILGSHYTDRPLFRFTTGLIPESVWQSSFGVDRAGLMGHNLDAAKLGAKIPLNLSGLDTFLSILEPLFASSSSLSNPQRRWLLNTDTPTAADISLYYQLDWGEKISRREGIHNLTGDGVSNTASTSTAMSTIFNRGRYPGLASWFEAVRSHFDALPEVETRIERNDDGGPEFAALISKINSSSPSSSSDLLLPTLTPPNSALDARIGLTPGTRVSIFPRDTGKANPTYGAILAVGTEEVVIAPDEVEGGGKARVEGVRLHFPRVEFGVVPVGRSGEGGAKL